MRTYGKSGLFRLAVTAVIFLNAGSASASTLPIFALDGKRATVLLRGSSSDPDAQRFFDLLAVAPQDEQGKITKKVKFVASDGTEALAIVCAFSKTIPGNGSCVITMKQAPGLTINASQRQAAYNLTGPEAALFAALFRSSSQEAPAYVSNDGHLQLTVADSAPTDPSFAVSLTYR